MTLEEMDRITKKAERIRSCQRELDFARRKLAAFNKHRAENKWPDSMQWEPSLTLKESDGYYRDAVTIKIRLPLGVVQQQLIDDVRKHERLLIQVEAS